jgi:lysylphosphatidylglycerol synthetase-like protein (DUF2156 family)
MRRTSQLRERDHTSARAVQEILAGCADNPSAFLALNRGNRCFRAPGVDGVVSYRRSGRHLIAFGGVFAPPSQRAELIRAFGAEARRQRCRVVAVQVQREDIERYVEQGCTVNQIGASYAVPLDGYRLRGGKFMQLRNKISRAHRAGVTVQEVDQADWAERMAALDATWLRAKGKHAKQLEFLVGEYGGPVQSFRRLFVGLLEGELVGYISYSPVYGGRSGWLHDLSRRVTDGTPGIMEAINKTAIDTFQAEGAPWLHFGFTPFTGLDPTVEAARRSRWFAAAVRQLAAHGESVYPARTQLAYKHKWDPIAIPEYVAFSGRASLTGFLQVFRAAKAL